MLYLKKMSSNNKVLLNMLQRPSDDDADEGVNRDHNKLEFLPDGNRKKLMHYFPKEIGLLL